MSNIKLDPCIHCKKPSTGVYGMAYAPISMQMCDECSKRPLMSAHNLITHIVRKESAEAAKKNFADHYEKLRKNMNPQLGEDYYYPQVYYNDKYMPIEDFFDEITIEGLDKIYSEKARLVNSFYKEVKKYLK